MLSALIVENRSESRSRNLTQFTMDTPVRSLFPEFKLPERDWKNGGKDITLSMLSSHTSGLPREGYRTDFNMVLGAAKADGPTIGSAWASAKPESVLEHIGNTHLMFAPGQRAACVYS